MDELLVDFLSESAENLESIGADLVRWEEAPGDRALLDRVFRVVHTIKGTCGFLNLPRLGRLAHAAEAPLAKARDGATVPDNHFISTILAAFDAIQAQLAALEAEGAEPDGNDDALIAVLETVGRDAGVVERSGIDRRNPLPGAARPAAAVRIGVNLLDELMESVSELVLARNALLQLGMAEDGGALATAIERLSASVSEVQDRVTRTRMQPIETLFGPLPRMVRDLAAELGKSVRLDLAGGRTELDRQLIEAIRDPVSHMIRNAVDHGIEFPDERRRRGKREEGLITVSAHQSGSQIVIELSDDGAGIDVEQLRSKVVGAGLRPAADVLRMSDDDARQLIFEPGLSTSRTVTAISGRGVGMDVVKTNIERIGGTVDLDSTPGQGTCIAVRVPLTLSIVPALMVEVGGQRLAIPQAGILEVARVDGPVAVEVIGDTELLRLRGSHFPVIDLARQLGLVPDEGERFAVLVRSGRLEPCAFLVDRLLDQEEIVIKPVAPVIAASGLYSGAAVLGDGRPVLILDLSAIGVAANLVERDGGSLGAARDAPPPAAAIDPLVLFRMDDGIQRAIPAVLVSRVETVPSGAIQRTSREWVLVRDDMTIPLRALAGIDPVVASQVLIIDQDGAQMALPISAVVDIVTDPVVIQSAISDDPMVAGTAVIDGQVTEILDPTALLGDVSVTSRRRGTVLCALKSGWAAMLLKPALERAGYDVIIADAEGLGRPEWFNGTLTAVLCDEEGARRLAAGGRVDGVPQVRLGGPDVPRGGLKANDRDAVLAALAAVAGQS